MIEWWSALPVELKFFYSIGIISMVIVIVQLLLAIIGLDGAGTDVDFDMNVGDVDHGSGIGMFSTQTIAAFFLAFGWIGVGATHSGINTAWVVLIAFGSGIISMFCMFYMLRWLMGLQARGNLEYKNAVGEVGTVYVTIPGSDKEGGQIQITIQSRLITANARKLTPGDLKPGQRVRVIEMNGPTDFVVEELTAESQPAAKSAD